MKRAVRALLGVALVATLVPACAPAASAGGSTASTPNRNIVTSEEMLKVGDVSVHEALSRIRPGFLRQRTGPTNGVMQQDVKVYVGGMLMPGLDHLREIMAKNVIEVAYLEPQQANVRFGGQNNGGAIVVLMK